MHSSVINLNKGNYKSWCDGILKHLRYHDITPHLYGLVPELGNQLQKDKWFNTHDHIVGLIDSHISVDTWYVIMDVECPHALWIRIWEMYGDSNVSPFPHDTAMITNIPQYDLHTKFLVEIEEIDSSPPPVASLDFMVASSKASSTSLQ